MNVNESYLNCLKCDVKKHLPKSLVETLLDPSGVENHKADFWVYQNQINLKKNFGLLNTPQSHYQVQLEKFNPQGAHIVGIYDQNIALTESIKNKMIARTADQQFKDIEHGPAARELEESATRIGKAIRAVSAPESTAKVSKASAKPALTVKASKENKAVSLAPAQTQHHDWIQAQFGAKSDLLGMRGQLFMKSQLFNSEVDLVAHRPLTEYVNAGALGARLISRMDLGNGLDRQNSELARFKLYRELPLVDVHASWMYGVSSQTMTSSLSKHFTSFLRAEVSRVDFMSMPGQYDQRAGLFLERAF